MNVFILLRCIDVLAAIWVYFDATKYKIGKISASEETKYEKTVPNNKLKNVVAKELGLNMQAGTWGFAVMLFGIVGSWGSGSIVTNDGVDFRMLLFIVAMLAGPISCYLICRSSLIQRAAEHPVTIRPFQRNTVLGMFLAVALLIIYLTVKINYV